MRVASWFVLWCVSACGGGAASKVVTSDPPPAQALSSVERFATLEDEARARALFVEMAKVFQHPRCANCHPVDDTPRQGLAQVVHEPPVARGPDNQGVPGLQCGSCHQDQNLGHARVPGAPHWALAPKSMGWIGVTLPELCAQLKDPARNGGRSLEAIHTHLLEDPLVAWGWQPGPERQPAPGSQAELAALARAWIDAGAHCPESP